MGCDVMLLRNRTISFERETQTQVINSNLFWDVKSYKLGIAFAEILGANTGWTPVCPDGFAELCMQMIADGEDDFGEYPDGALRAVVEDLSKLDDETKWRSDWFITMDY